jgi:hypothetical protein
MIESDQAIYDQVRIQVLESLAKNNANAVRTLRDELQFQSG